MKTKISFLILYLLLSWSYSKSQTVAFEVFYDVQEHTYYNIDSNVMSQLLPQDLVKLSPETNHEQKHEVYNTDGTFVLTTTYQIDNHFSEKWLDNVTKTVVYNDQLEVYVDDSLYYVEATNPDSEIIDPCSFSAFYLATNDWILPLEEDYIEEMISAGYVILQNGQSVLELKNENEQIIFDKNNRSETKIIFDFDGNETSREIMFYKKDDSDHWVYDLQIIKTKDLSTSPCFEKTIVRNYKNVNRIFYDSDCEPPPSVASSESATNFPNSTPTICGYQIPQTMAVELQIPEELPDEVNVLLIDIYGQPITETINVKRASPFLELENVPTGVYSIRVPEFQITSCKFLFQP